MSSNKPGMGLPACFYVLLTLPAVCDAATTPQMIACPESIDVVETVQPPLAAWSVMPDSGKTDHSLESIRVYSGHPAEMANLAPDQSSKQRDQLITTWTLSPRDPLGYWVACTYRNSATMLALQLPKLTSSCRLTDKTAPSGALVGISSFTCQ